MDEPIWNAWRRDWVWIAAAVRRRGYEASLEVAPPAPADEVERLVQENNLILPPEYTEVLARFSARARVDWHIGRPGSIRPPAGVPEPYNWLVRRGAGELWDAGALPFLRLRYEAWLERFEELEADDRAANLTEFAHLREHIWHGKSPFLALGNGDLFAFDVARGTAGCPVVYLDHEWGRSNGCRLGLDFIDFISRWSRLGCPAPLSLLRFHDPVQNLLADSGEFVEGWKRWLSR